MAEFCLECFNKMNGTHLTGLQVIREFDLCEGCGEIKPCVVRYRNRIGASWEKLGLNIREYLRRKEEERKEK